MESNSSSQLRRLAVILNDSNDAITVQDLDGNILAWNKGAERMYGYTEAEALKMNISNIVPKDKKSEALLYLERIAKGDIIESFETVRTRKDGKILTVWLVLTCLKNDEGQIDTVATTERDITATKLEIKQLRGMIPICANCKNIRNDKGYWQQIESYIEKNSEAIFSHGLCPACLQELYGDEPWYNNKD